MRVFIKYLFSFAAIIAATVSCTKQDWDMPDYSDMIGRDVSDGTPSREQQPNPRRTFLIYSAGYNNLASDLIEDIDDVCNDYVPPQYFGDKLLVFAQHYSYVVEHYEDGTWQIVLSPSATNPCLIDIYRDKNDNVIRDTVYRWSADDVDAVKPETLTMVLNYVKENYPSGEYGMLFSSHGTGWLPVSYSEEITSKSSSADSDVMKRSIGQSSKTGEEMDVKDFAAAIPYKLDYIILDACLCGGIEVAYELKDACKYIISSSSEIWSDGMVYLNIASRLLGEYPSNLQGVAEDFYNYYNDGPSEYRNATVSLVDCSQLEKLAAVCADIFTQTRWNTIMNLNPNNIQKTNRVRDYRRVYSFYYFYDFRDILAHLSLTSDEEAALDEALAACILYKANTEYLIGGIPIPDYSGLSMYLPRAINSASLRSKLNGYYLKYKWNRDAGYIPDNPDLW